MTHNIHTVLRSGLSVVDPYRTTTMTPVLLFSVLAVAWALYAVPAARKRFKLDHQALTLGLVAAVASAATMVVVGLLVGGSPGSFWWVLVPVLVVLLATVMAERRRSTVLRARRRTQEPAHGA